MTSRESGHDVAAHAGVFARDHCFDAQLFQQIEYQTLYRRFRCQFAMKFSVAVQQAQGDAIRRSALRDKVVL